MTRFPGVVDLRVSIFILLSFSAPYNIIFLLVLEDEFWFYFNMHIRPDTVFTTYTGPTGL